jgi:hypothetical protein
VKKVMGYTIPSLHPSSWVTDVFRPELCPSEIVAVVVCGAWSLWTGRNARRLGRKVWEPGTAVRYISKLLEEMVMLKVPTRPAKPRLEVKWQKPEVGWCKVNTDAAFDPASGAGSVGVVIRDEQGQVIVGAARWFDLVPDVLTTEALAANEGLELTLEMGCDQVILETDCSTLKALLVTSEGMRSSIGDICFDISELGRSFVGFRVDSVSRDANSVAHCCARMVSATERSLFWLDYIPEWLVGLAVADCTPVID